MVPVGPSVRTTGFLAVLVARLITGLFTVPSEVAPMARHAQPMTNSTCSIAGMFSVVVCVVVDIKAGNLVMVSSRA